MLHIVDFLKKEKQKKTQVSQDLYLHIDEFYIKNEESEQKEENNVIIIDILNKE